jgi:hypothetical protein
MLHYSRTNHIEVDVGNTSHQVGVGLHSGGMVSAFPESTFAFFPAIEFLRCSPCNQLHGSPDFPLAQISQQQMNVIGCRYVI